MKTSVINTSFTDFHFCVINITLVQITAKCLLWRWNIRSYGHMSVLPYNGSFLIPSLRLFLKGTFQPWIMDISQWATFVNYATKGSQSCPSEVHPRRQRPRRTGGPRGPRWRGASRIWAFWVFLFWNLKKCKYFYYNKSSEGFLWISRLENDLLSTIKQNTEKLTFSLNYVYLMFLFCIDWLTISPIHSAIHSEIYNCYASLKTRVLLKPQSVIITLE